MHEINCVFRCDPKRNKECEKIGCQRECFYTAHKEYSADGKLYAYFDFYSCYEEVKEIDQDE